MAATTISRTNIGTDDDGSGSTGTAINAAYIGLIYNNIDALFTGTGGVTYNQAGGDGAILTFESTDVAHGMTSFAATAAYSRMMKNVAASGGLDILGLSSAVVALQLNGYATTDDTAKNNNALAPVVVYGAKKSGTGVVAGGANANVVVFQSAGVTRHIFDVEGDSHQDVGTAFTNFDAFDDIELLNALTGVVSQPQDPLKAEFAGLVTKYRDALVAQRIVTINDGPSGDGSIFLNWSRFHMVMLGAVRQLARELVATRDRLQAIEGRG